VWVLLKPIQFVWHTFLGLVKKVSAFEPKLKLKLSHCVSLVDTRHASHDFPLPLPGHPLPLLLPLWSEPSPAQLVSCTTVCSKFLLLFALKMHALENVSQKSFCKVRSRFEEVNSNSLAASEGQNLLENLPPTQLTVVYMRVKQNGQRDCAQKR